MSKELSQQPNKYENVKVLPKVDDADLDNHKSVKSPKLFSKINPDQDIDYLKSDKPFVIARFFYYSILLYTPQYTAYRTLLTPQYILNTNITKVYLGIIILCDYQLPVLFYIPFSNSTINKI